MSEHQNSEKASLNSEKQFCQRPNADKIPCPALLSFYNNGLLQPDENGTVTTAHLEDVLASVGVSSMIRKVLVRGADKTDDIPNSFNLFNLHNSSLDHSGSTGIRDPEVNPEKLQDALIQFSENGRMYARNFAAAANHAYSHDPGVKGTVTQSVEFASLLDVFGRVDEAGNRYLTVDDVTGLWLEGKYPDDWKPRAVGEIGLVDLVGGVSKIAVQRFLSSWPKFFG